MRPFSFWKSGDSIQEERTRLQKQLEKNELAFLTSTRRLVQQRNRALQKGSAQQALVHEEMLRKILECYEIWKNNDPARSALSIMLASPTSIAGAGKTFHYLADSLFLMDCYHFLMHEDGTRHSGNITRKPEWACAVTGPLIGNVRVLDRLVIVKIAHQSAGGIRLSVEGIQQALLDLQDAGHALHAVFHSHRMAGVEASKPSRIDLDTQEQILEAAYPAIQAIFTEDGYIRFFSLKRQFKIEVFGKGVNHVEGTVFKLGDFPLTDEAIMGGALSTYSGNLPPP